MLDQAYISKIRDPAYTICIQVCCCDGFRTGIWGIGEHDCGSSKVGVKLSTLRVGVVRLCPSLFSTQCMSQQSAASKPSLQGVRIKARKGAVKAQAKHEPTSIYSLFI
jgi:hypothetical protein